MGSPETLKGLDKVYAIDYIVQETFEGDLRSGVVAPDRLPLALGADGTVTAKLPVGEDIVANAPAGKGARAKLRLRLSSLAQGDEVSVKLNGQTLGMAAPTEPLSAEPASAWVELAPDPNLVTPGYNLVEIQLFTSRRLDQSVALDRLDLAVHYE